LKLILFTWKNGSGAYCESGILTLMYDRSYWFLIVFKKAVIFYNSSKQRGTVKKWTHWPRAVFFKLAVATHVCVADILQCVAKFRLSLKFVKINRFGSF
jgi:hypothetical protein